MPSQRPLFSVVLPCYKVERYLPTALSQLLGQTLEDFELIVVDDASPDSCGAFAAKAASEDSRVRVITHTTNQGLSAARNTGLAAARGHYVWMPDPDDEYDADLLAKVALSTLEVPGGPDVVLFGYRECYFDTEGNPFGTREVPLPDSGTWGTPDAWHGKLIELEQSTHFGYAWNKCYKLDALRKLGLDFINVRLIEDVTFNVAFFKHAKSVVALDAMPYAYRKQEGRSLTGAQSYGAQEYWALHQRRIQMVRDLLESWGVLDDALPTLGSLYVRYLLSATYRTFLDVDAGRFAWTDTIKGRWLLGIYRSNLFCEMVPYARASSSSSLQTAIEVARTRNAMAFMSLAHGVYAVRKANSKLFHRARSGR